jgi:hypothetical protein
MKRLKRIIIVLGILIALGVPAWLVVQSSGSNTFMARMHASTMAGYQYYTDPPWVDGNSFTVIPRWTYYRECYLEWLPQSLLDLLPKSRKGGDEGWGVINMTTENFSAFCKTNNVASVRVEPYDEMHCLIVDRRIPREWLRYASHARMAPADQRKLRQERPECFRKEQESQEDLWATWERVEIVDPDGLLAELLPGERIRFEAIDLDCLSAEGESVGQRYWRVGVEEQIDFLTVYELKADGYSGLLFEVELDGENLELVPRSKLNGNPQRGYQVATYKVRGPEPRLYYRLVRTADDASNTSP